MNFESTFHLERGQLPKTSGKYFSEDLLACRKLRDYLTTRKTDSPLDCTQWVTPSGPMFTMEDLEIDLSNRAALCYGSLQRRLSDLGWVLSAWIGFVCGELNKGKFIRVDLEAVIELIQAGIQFEQ